MSLVNRGIILEALVLSHTTFLKTNSSQAELWTSKTLDICKRLFKDHYCERMTHNVDTLKLLLLFICLFWQFEHAVPLRSVIYQFIKSDITVWECIWLDCEIVTCRSFLLYLVKQWNVEGCKTSNVTEAVQLYGELAHG